ncbi:UNVERIFIED_CONTAM: copper amine oxidase-like protein [Acetivibrio alkalicellulosi]
MVNKKVKIAVVSSAIMFCTSIAVFGASVNSEIKAILSREVSVRYQGVVQEMRDGSGNVVYPIMYNGTTYLPIRAVSNMLDLPVDWEASTKTVILGTEQKEPRSVLRFDAKTSDFSSKVTDKGSLTVEGDLGAVTVFDDGVSFRIWNASSSSNIARSYQAQIGGGYSKLSFDAYVPGEGYSYILRIYNVDTGESLANIDIEGGQIKKIEEIDITGVKTVGFAADAAITRTPVTTAYFFNPIVE